MELRRVAWEGVDADGLAARLRSETPADEQLSRGVGEILDAVRERGDHALRELTERLDAPDMSRWSLRIGADAVAAASHSLDSGLREALQLAADNIEAVAAADLPAPVDLTLEQGQSVALADHPVSAAAVYVPGGRAAYPSSALMGCAPARAAGVKRVVIASPPGPDGSVDPGVLWIAERYAVEEIYAIGGAQAVAALAYGTQTIARVDVIAGPGNAWVTEAKRRVYGTVGIDGLAGPSELVVVFERRDARHVALDLLAQAEHGPDGLLVAISSAAALDELEARLTELAPERATVLARALALVESPGVDAALTLADALAPEHLELLVDGAERLARERVAGCVFVGPGAATAFGDYAAGSNHVLPTAGAARFGAPLSPRAFMRRSAVVSMPGEAADALAEPTDAIARAEGLPVHGESARARTPTKTPDAQVRSD